MANKLKLGVAGIGTEGQAVLRDAEKYGDVELTAVADLRPEALATVQKRYPNVEPFTSIEAMCEQGEVDAVWIATPSEYHSAHTIVVAERGKNIVLEKPMALTLDDCERALDAVEQNGAQLLMHSHASDQPVRKMREIIESGRLGRLINITTISYKGWLKSPRMPAELDTSKGGGIVFRQAPHQIEIVRRIGGGLVGSVLAYTGRWAPGLNTEGNFTALLEFQDGTPAILVLNGYGRFDITDLTFHIGEGGTESQHRYERRPMPTGPVDPTALYAAGGRHGGERESAANRPRHQPIYGLTLVSCEKGDMRQSPEGLYVYTDDGCEEIICPPYEDRATEMREMRDALAEGRPVFPNGRWGMATLEVQLAILESSRAKQRINLSHQVAVPAKAEQTQAV